MDLTRLTLEDRDRLEQLLKLSSASSIRDRIHQEIEQEKSDFVIETETWQERQLVHILAASYGYNSRKEAQMIVSDFHQIMYDQDGQAGYCLKCRIADYKSKHCKCVSYSGHVHVSKEHLKLGRDARRRRNRWKYGKFVAIL